MTEYHGPALPAGLRDESLSAVSVSLADAPPAAPTLGAWPLAEGGAEISPA